MLKILKIFLGLIFSYFLKDINFLSLQFNFLNSEVIYPDFVIIFIIFFSLQNTDLFGIWIGFFAGLLEDSTILKFSKSEYTPLIGIHTLVYPILGYTLAKLNRFVDIHNNSTILFITFVSTFVSRTVVWILFGVMDTFYESYSILATSLYTCILAPMWFMVLKWIYPKP